MADELKITELPAASSVTSSTLVPVVDMSGTPTTQKATADLLLGGLPDATTGNRGIATVAQATLLANATSSNTVSTLVQRDANGDFAARNLTANLVTGLATPTNASDAANKAYVDSAAAGLSVKSPARGATTGSNITLSGGAPSTLDGLTLALNNRILVKDQTDPKENGIYSITTLGTGSNGTWTRSTDADTGAELVQGSYIFIQAGTTNGGSSWVMTTPNPITIGTSNIVWFLYNQITNVPASAITGQIINSQIANAAITTAQFASGITPVEIVNTLPSTGNFAGRTVYLTSDAKLYRYNGSAFTTAVATVDLSGQITTTQITDNSISTPKLQSNSITTAKLAANCVTANELSANSVVSGKIAAGAVSTTELAVGGVTGTKIANGTIATANIAAGAIVASLINVTSLSAISANMGTLTSGSITVSSGASAVSITGSGMTIAGGAIDLRGSGGNPAIAISGGSGSTILLSTNSGSNPAFIQASDGSSAIVTISAGIFSASGGSGVGVLVSGTQILLQNGADINMKTGSAIQSTGGGTGGQINLFGGNAAAISVVAGEDATSGSLAGYAIIQLNGRAVKMPFYDL